MKLSASVGRVCLSWVLAADHLVALVLANYSGLVMVCLLLEVIRPL